MLGTFLLFTALAQANFCTAPPHPALAKLTKLAAADDWFHVYQLDSRTYAIQESRQAEGVISYLILGSKRALLFDSGFGIGRIDKVVRALTKLRVTVLNSHSHYDHVGGNGAFADVIGFDSDYTRGHARGVPNAEAARHVSPAMICPPLPDGVTAESYKILPYRIERYVKDGEMIDLGDRKLEILLTPGHTPDSLCLWDRASRALFTGDTFYPSTLWLWVPETDLKLYRQSMERLARMASQLDVLRPAHTAPEADPKVFAKVLRALDQVESGSMNFEERGERRLYKFDGFSILVAKPK